MKRLHPLKKFRKYALWAKHLCKGVIFCLKFHGGNLIARRAKLTSVRAKNLILANEKFLCKNDFRATMKMCSYCSYTFFLTHLHFLKHERKNQYQNFIMILKLFL